MFYYSNFKNFYVLPYSYSLPDELERWFPSSTLTVAQDTSGQGFSLI